MPQFRGKWLVILVILGLLGGVAWWQRKPYFARYYVNQLGGADEATRDGWVAGIIALEEAAVPALLDALDKADQKTCDNLAFALVGLAQTWGPSDARSLALLGQVTSRFDSLNMFAKNTALQIPIVLLQKTPGQQNPPPLVTGLAGDLLTEAAKHDELQVSTLQLAGVLVEHLAQGKLLELARELAVNGLNSVDAEARALAIQLILRPPFRQENDLLARVVPFLKDKAGAVRKAALVALGSARALVSDDDLLALLHDPDDEVQNLCELTLQSRGLPENHILLARLVSDERPSARLQIFLHLGEDADLEPGVWLRRLCQDPAPAVRAAAVRAAVAQSQVDLRSYLLEMAAQDPSPSVRQLAGYYINRFQSISAE